MLSVRLTFGFESTFFVRWGCDGGGRGGVELSLFRGMVRRLFAFFVKGFLRHDSFRKELDGGKSRPEFVWFGGTHCP